MKGAWVCCIALGDDSLFYGCISPHACTVGGFAEKEIMGEILMYVGPKLAYCYLDSIFVLLGVV